MIRQKIILLIALLMTLILFFWMQNVGEQPAILVRGFTMLITTSLDILTVAIIVAISGGIGSAVRERWQFNGLNTAEAIALDSGIGLGLISIGVLFLGLVGLFNLTLWVVLILIAVLLRKSIFRWLQAVRALVAIITQPQSGWERFIVIVSGALLLAAVLLALAPPFHWDAMTYHLVGPQRYVDIGRITTQADNHFLGFPQNMEMLYGLALSLFRRPTAVAPLHWVMGILALVAIAGILRRYTNRSTAMTSVLLALSSYGLWDLFGIPYVDLAVMSFGALALIAAIRWRENEQSRWLILTGVIMGLALGVKYTAGLYIIALGIVIFMHNPRRIVTHGLLFGLGVLLAFAPWLLKGALLYANPIYPYLFDGVSWDALRAANFNAVGNRLLATENAWQWFILPLSAAFLGRSGGNFDFVVGMWLFTLPFVLLIGWRQIPQQARLLAKTCIWLALTMLILWMFIAATSGIGAQPRLVLVGFPAIIVLGTLALHSLTFWPQRPLNINFLVRALLGFTVLLNGFNVIHDLSRANLPQYYVEQDVDGFLRNNLGNYYGMMQQLETLPADSNVLFMWEPKSFYCPTTIICVPDVLFDNWWRPLILGKTPDELIQQWQADGVDYLLVIGLNEGSGIGYDFWLDQHRNAQAENRLFPVALEAYLEPVWTDGAAYTLFTWRS